MVSNDSTITTHTARASAPNALVSVASVSNSASATDPMKFAPKDAKNRTVDSRMPRTAAFHQRPP